MDKDVAENIWFYPEYQEVVVFGVDFHYFKLLNSLGVALPPGGEIGSG